MADRLKTLVTGASGFIGTTLTEHLLASDKFTVAGIDRVAPRESWQHSIVAACDLLDYDQVEARLWWRRPDAVVHCAAQARVEPSVTDPLGTYDLNVRATMNLMKACKRVGVSHLIVLSSEAVYGKARVYPSPENNDFAPINPYAASKVAVDVLAQQFDTVLPTTVIRSGMGWGVRSNPREQVVAKFIVKALRGEELKFPVGDVQHPTRDLNHVSDFSCGVMRILEKRARGVYNLSGGREYTVHDIAERVVKAVGSGSIVEDPAYAYRPGEVGFRTFLDVSKAERDLGHKPMFHLEGKALAETVDWYRTRLDGAYWR